MAQKFYLVEKESAAFKLFGVKSSSFYLERPLNAKTFRDGGQTPFGMNVNAVAWQFFCRIPSRIPALSGVLAKNVIYAFFRLAFQLFGVKISSFYLERPLNAKTFRDGGQKPFSTFLCKVENGFRPPSRKVLAFKGRSR